MAKISGFQNFLQVQPNKRNGHSQVSISKVPTILCPKIQITRPAERPSKPFQILL
jgi:hypothetical protein